MEMMTTYLMDHIKNLHQFNFEDTLIVPGQAGHEHNFTSYKSLVEMGHLIFFHHSDHTL